jgi:hypothetical protein
LCTGDRGPAGTLEKAAARGSDGALEQAGARGLIAALELLVALEPAGVALLILGPLGFVLAALGPLDLLFAPTPLLLAEKQMLSELATRGLPFLWWSAPGPDALRWQYSLVAVLHYQTALPAFELMQSYTHPWQIIKVIILTDNLQII